MEIEKEQDPVTLTGRIESVVFHNASNGWTVLEVDSGEELVTVVGPVFDVSPGEELRFMGDWVNHPTYGRQFKSQACERCTPATVEAILRYLSSGAVRGVGPSTAKHLVDAFGADTLDIMENHPDRLTQIRGISPKKAEAISEEYKQQFGVRTLMLFLQQYGVTPAESIRIWRKWGTAAMDLIKANPYALCAQGLWIRFERADQIAEKMGFTKSDPGRVRAGVEHVLRHNLFSGGHTYIPYEKLTAAASGLLQVPEALTEEAVDSLSSDEELTVEEIAGRRAVFLPESYGAESYIAGRILLMRSITPPPLGDSAARMEELERRLGIRYADKQRLAILTACESNLMILTGGPGTGKTTTLNGIIGLYEEMGLKVALAAPTGRAAKRMSEVSGREAKTIHRLLEMEYSVEDEPHFSRCEKNPLDCDAVIVDELSMVDALLFESLLRAMKLSCRLIMVGDADQLPPVGAGNVLRDLIASGKVPVVKLDEIFRQAAQSLIVLNAHRIVRGETPDLENHGSDFFFMPRYTPEQVRTTVRDLVTTRLPAAYGYSPLWDIQVLVPGRKGPLGVNELNPVLQQVLNPPERDRAERPLGPYTLREGDKVMQVKNNYDIVWKKENGERGTGVFNGDVGVLTLIEPRTGTLRVKFDDRTAEYGPESAQELELAYAVTVHKSQGSEFRAVVLPLFTGAPQLFYRNLLYTAVTRARELVVIVGRPSTVGQMVENNRKTRRYTGLCEMLRGPRQPDTAE